MLLIIKLIFTKYKKYNSHYTILIQNNTVLKVKREKPEIKYNYILLYIKYTLSKLIKY